MKLAILLRGISFYNDTDNVSCSAQVNYKDSYHTFTKNVLEPLRQLFGQNIDIFLLTYYNPMLQDIIADYSPRDVKIYPASSITCTPRDKIVQKLLLDSIDMVESYGNEYDHVLISRFDLYFYNPLPISRIDLSKFNFDWLGPVGQCGDNFLLFNRGKYMSILKKYLQQSNYTHGINTVFRGHENYISVPLDPDNGYHWPDFYFINRMLSEYNQGTLLLK